MSIIPPFEPKRTPSERTIAQMRHLLEDTAHLRIAYRKLAEMRPEFREYILLDLLTQELSEVKPRRTFIHGLYTRYSEVRRQREVAELMNCFDE